MITFEQIFILSKTVVEIFTLTFSPVCELPAIILFGPILLKFPILLSCSIIC